METIPSESVCYPAKLVHGHIANLVHKGVKRIFYPSLPYEQKEDLKANNHYNCPIVTSYPEVIRNNMDLLAENNVDFIHPFLPIYDKKRMAERLYEVFAPYGCQEEEIRSAAEAAYTEYDRFKADIRKKAEEIIEYAVRTASR